MADLMQYVVKSSAPVTLSLFLSDDNTPANNPVTGYTCIASIERLSDNKWWNFVGNTWDTVAPGSLAANNKLSLTDKSTGEYAGSWDQYAADGGAAGTYAVWYRVTSAGTFQNRVDCDLLVFSLPGVVASVTGNVGGTIGGLAAQAQTDVESALTVQGLTTARAAKLDDLDATVSSRAAPGAQMDLVAAPNATAVTAIVTAVWASLTSALTTAGSIGRKLANWVLGSDNKAAISTDVQDLHTTLSTNAASVGDKTGYALTTAPPTAGQIDTQLSTTHGAGAWGDFLGSGAWPVTLTVHDGSGNPVQNAKVAINATGGRAVGIANSTGHVSFNLDAGTYVVDVGTAASYTPANPYTVVVDGSGNVTGGTLVVTAVTVAPPSDPGLCRCYVYFEEISGGAALGAGTAQLRIQQIVSVPAGETAVLVPGGQTGECDASGFAYLDLVQGATVRVEATWPNGGVAISDAFIVPAGSYNLAGLLQ